LNECFLGFNDPMKSCL